MTQWKASLPRRRHAYMRGLALFILCIALWTLTMPVTANGSGTRSVMGQSYTLAEGETWNGDLAVIGGTAHLLDGSTLNGSVSAIGGNVQIDGIVNGDVIGMGATFDLGQHAVVQGDLVVLGTLRQHPDARVLGEVVQGGDATKHLQALPGILGSSAGQLGAASTPAMTSRLNTARRMGRWFTWMLTLLVAAALIELVLPQNIERVSSALVGSWIASTAAGLLTLFASAVVIPLLVIICLGIPVAIVLGIALILALLMGWVAVGKILGSRLLLALHTETSTPMLDTLVGVVLLSMVTAIPCLGPLFSIGVSAWGMGSIALTRFGARAYPPLPPGPERPTSSDQAPHDTHPLDQTKAPPEDRT